MAKKRPFKKRKDFATAKAYQKYKKRAVADRARRADRVARAIYADKVMLANMLPSTRKLMKRLDSLTPDEFAEVSSELQRQLRFAQMTMGWVDDLEISKLRKNMSIAIEPSRLRHLGTVTDEMEKLLNRAARKGDRALRKKAKEFAEYFDVPVREVYTLFFSP